MSVKFFSMLEPRRGQKTFGIHLTDAFKTANEKFRDKLIGTTKFHGCMVKILDDGELAHWKIIVGDSRCLSVSTLADLHAHVRGVSRVDKLSSVA